MKKQFGLNKLIVLLGAGASCDANIKNSVQMIREIEDKLETDWTEYKDLYNYVESSHFRLERIKNVRFPQINFNIENLVGLLDTIIRIAQKDVEGYNFVGAWEKELIIVANNDFSRAQKFKNEILKKLKEKWLSPNDFKTASAYYKKIIDTGYTHPLKIFSLNYDMCVEQAIESEGKNLERGFDENRLWDYRRYDTSRDGNADFYLYKLHGSIDWIRDEEMRLTFVDGVQTINPLDMQIIFGVQNKLQSYDPFNFYFYALREACFEAELIVASGYGFMDKHINDNLSNAFKINPNKKLLINNLLKDTEKQREYLVNISERLKIPLDKITLKSESAKEFFNSSLNLNYFSSLFPDDAEESDVLP
jgi:hypothetical protein